jgi:hypothetical protein
MRVRLASPDPQGFSCGETFVRVRVSNGALGTILDIPMHLNGKAVVRFDEAPDVSVNVPEHWLEDVK